MLTSALRRALAGLALVSVLALAGCSSTPPEPRPSNSGSNGSETLTQMIDTGLANAQSDFQEEVLTEAKKTGQISEADWKEANNRYKTCLTEQGFQVEIIYRGSTVQIQGEVDGKQTPADREARQKADLSCYQKTAAHINEIYAYLNDDGSGNGLDGDTVQRAVLACLIDRELAPADTTYDEFVADLEQNDGKQFAPNGQDNEAEITKCWMENT